MIYSLILRLRHLFYDKGWKKSTPTEIPSLCVGNIAVGGTGKTPMVELVIKTLKEGNVEAADSAETGFAGPDENFPRKDIAVLSRGYKRKTRGFQQVTFDAKASQVGDEPLQIKRKHPDVTVVVDEKRVEGAAFLADSSRMESLSPKKRARILAPEFERPEIIILDDAYQHRKIKATANMVLTTYDEPFSKDHVLPWGRLRDLRSRAMEADMIVVTKCPIYVGEAEKFAFAKKLGFKAYDSETCMAVGPKGEQIRLLFAIMVYDKLQAVFPEGDPHYIHSKMAMAISGIARGEAFIAHVGDGYKLQGVRTFADHHNFSKADIRALDEAAKLNPLAVIVTTEKDAQRLRDTDASQELRRRMFYAPVRTQMLTGVEQNVLKEFLLSVGR